MPTICCNTSNSHFARQRILVCRENVLDFLFCSHLDTLRTRQSDFWVHEPRSKVCFWTLEDRYQMLERERTILTGLHWRSDDLFLRLSDSTASITWNAHKLDPLPLLCSLKRSKYCFLEPRRLLPRSPLKTPPNWPAFIDYSSTPCGIYLLLGQLNERYYRIFDVLQTCTSMKTANYCSLVSVRLNGRYHSLWWHLARAYLSILHFLEGITALSSRKTS